MLTLTARPIFPTALLAFAALLAACDDEPDATPDAGPLECEADPACAALGDGFVCRDRACVPDPCPEPLANGCDDLYGPLEGDPESTIAARRAAWLADRDAYELIAVHTPRGGFAVAGKTSIEAAVRVAVEDINASGAFADIEGNGRKLAALICDDAAGSIESGILAARHAVACGAKALVATDDSEATRQLYLQVARPAHIPVIAPGAASAAVGAARTLGGTAPDDGLLWRVRVPGEVTARATAAAIRGIDHHRNVAVFYRASARNPVTDALEPDPEGPALWQAFERELCQDDFCQRANVTGHGITEPSSFVTSAVATSLRDRFALDLVVTLTPDLSDLLAVVTGVAVVAAETGHLPEIIQVDGARSAQFGPIFLASFANSQIDRSHGIELLCNMVGISASSVGDAYAQWFASFQARAEFYPDFPAGGAFAPLLVAATPRYFDAVSLTAYAMAAAALAAPDGQINTAGIIDGLGRLADYTRDRVPPFEWQAGITALRTPAPGGGPSTMNYEGASGPVDLDPLTGDLRDQHIDLWQYRIEDRNGDIATPVRTVQSLLSAGDARADGIEVNLATFEGLQRFADACPAGSYPGLVTPLIDGR